jgi:hypothetical protein
MKKFPLGSRVIVRGETVPGTVVNDVRFSIRRVNLDNGEQRIRYVNDLAKIGSDKTIIISVRGGCVQDVEGLPPGWLYLLLDYDNLEAEKEA